MRLALAAIVLTACGSPPTAKSDTQPPAKLDTPSGPEAHGPFSEPRDGFAEIRWTDTQEMVATRFGGRARTTATVEGRDPKTGRSFRMEPGLAMDDYPHDPTAKEIQLSTSLDFDVRGVTEFAVSAVPVADTSTWRDAEWAHFNVLAGDLLRRLGDRLKLPSVSLELQDQHWTVDGVRVTVAIDTGPGDFVLFVKRPGQ